LLLVRRLSYSPDGRAEPYQRSGTQGNLATLERNPLISAWWSGTAAQAAQHSRPSCWRRWPCSAACGAERPTRPTKAPRSVLGPWQYPSRKSRLAALKSGLAAAVDEKRGSGLGRSPPLVYCNRSYSLLSLSCPSSQWEVFALNVSASLTLARVKASALASP